MGFDAQGPQQGAPSTDLDDLLEVAHACLQEWGLVKFPYEVAGEYDKAFRVGFPLVAHAFNSTQVALDVWERFPWVARANARVAFEHAFVAQWGFLTPDGPEHFMRHISHSNLIQAQEFAKAIAGQPKLTSLVPAEDLADFQRYADQEPIPGNERSWSLQALFSRFETSGLLYGSYRSLSAAVHPSTGTIAAHLDVREQEPLQIRLAGSGSVDRHESAQALALAALWALNFVEKCAPGYQAPGRAGAIAIPKALPYDLAHSDHVHF